MTSETVRVKIAFQSHEVANNFRKEWNTATAPEGVRIARLDADFQSVDTIVEIAMKFVENGGLEAVANIAAMVAAFVALANSKQEDNNDEKLEADTVIEVGGVRITVSSDSDEAELKNKIAATIEEKHPELGS